jgi:hypothetical protein
MNEYLVFIGNIYYPSGGWDDFSGYFESIEKAKEHIKSFDPAYKWGHIVRNGEIVIKASGKALDYYNHRWVFSDE